MLVSYYKRFVWEKRILWSCLLGLLLILAAWEALHLPMITSTDAIIPRDKAWRFYQAFRQQFGADDALVIALETKDALSPSVISYVQNLTEAFSTVPEIEEVLSLTNVEDIVGTPEGFVVEPLIGTRNLSKPEEKRKVEQRLRKNPLILGNLISEDLRTTIILLRTAYRGEDLDFESRLIHKVENVLKRYPNPPGTELHLSGWPLINVKMASFMNQDLMVFVPASFISLCLLVYIFLRSFRIMLAVALILNFSLVLAMAMLKLVGGALSPMTAILAPLTMALALADVIHVVTSYLHLPATPQRVEKTFSETWHPCFLTSLTTAIGFGSLVLSRIPSIREFGMAAAGTMFAEYALAFTLLVFLLPWIARGKWNESTLKRVISPLAQRYPAWSTKALIGFSLITLLSLGGLMRLRVDSDIIKYFHRSTKVYQDAIFIDQHIGGAQTIEISLQRPEGDFLDPEVLKKVEELTRFLAQDPIFKKVVSPIDFFKMMHRAFHGDKDEYFTLPSSRALLAQYLLLYGGTELDHFLNEDRNWLRISARTPVHSSALINQKLKELSHELERLFRESNVSYRLTGKTYLINRTVDDIVNCQVESLLLAALLIFGLMFLVLRSARLGLLSILPNVFPLLANLGFMGLVGISLNTATATISAVAIGMAVDDTIHFLVRYRRERRSLPPEEAVKNTLLQKGLAAITTSLVLIMGFLILTTSRFIPTVEFGFLCALVMFLALLADLFLLPALVKVGRRWF